MNLFVSLLNQELRKAFSYRVNFWMQFFGQTIGEISISYFLWKALFQSDPTGTIGGMTFDHMLQYYILLAFTARIVRGREGYSVSSDIYDGGLTRYLIYPAPYLLFKIAEHAGHLAITTVQFFIGLGLASLAFESLREVFFSPSLILAGLVFSIVASFMYFMLQFLLELVAFWADNIWSLTVMLRFIFAFFGGMMLPLSLFPDWAQSAIQLTPFPAMGSIPIRIMMGEVGGLEAAQALLIMASWSLPFLLITVIVWRRGVYQFTGVGQ